jgi:hypothetical protein
MRTGVDPNPPSSQFFGTQGYYNTWEQNQLKIILYIYKYNWVPYLSNLRKKWNEKKVETLETQFCLKSFLLPRWKCREHLASHAKNPFEIMICQKSLLEANINFRRA